MCSSPISIDNPLYGKTNYATELGGVVRIPTHLHSIEKTIEVPCGKCAECRSSYFSAILQRALVESRTSYMYFVTLTYDDKHIPSIILPNNERVFYSDYSDIQNLFKRIRRNNIFDRDFRYLCALEYGDRNCRPHFHLLLYLAKKETDDKQTPYHLERLIFDNLRKYYALNVGTRKQPKYEPLFTFAVRYTTKGIKSNYFVKYVEPTTTNEAYKSEDNEAFLKTIRYLIGYVNKGSAFDSTIKKYLEDVNDDIVRRKLSSILRSKLIYSKGFGCGFVNGHKSYLPRISVKSSFSTLIYTQIKDTLPNDLATFFQLYPDKVKELEKHILCFDYSKFTDVRTAISSMTEEIYELHCIFLLYFPRAWSIIYNRYYRFHDSSKLSYLFNFLHTYKYRKPFVRTTEYINTPTFQYIRAGVTEAIQNKVPYIAFKNIADDTYIALCKYYRERCTTIHDLQDMYDSLGISSHREWKELFSKQYSTLKANISASNTFTHEQSEKIIQKTCKSQKNVPIFAQREISQEQIYTKLLSNY